MGVRLLVFAAATLLGWLLVSIGLGVGLPRTGAGGLGIALAVAPLVAGVAFVVTAGIALFRTTHGWARLILLPWFLAVLIAVYSLSVALAAVYPPRSVSRAAMPAGATEIEMTAADGVHLSGWYLPSRNGAAVVLRHGAASTAGDTAAHAQILHDAGFGVLATDARGHGNSGGQGMDLGWYGEMDIRAAVDALVDRTDVDPRRVAVVGLSMGGEEAIGAAGTDDRIRAVVAEGATGRTAADKTWLADAYGVRGVAQVTLDLLTYGFVDLLTPPSPPATLAQSVRDAPTTPLLLIAAGNDADEQAVATRLAAVGPARVDVWVADDAGHVEALRTAPDEWRARVVGFLDIALADGTALRQRAPSR
ncbi:hypothetical protein GCM10017690_25360 [Microbacterium terregens]